MSQTERPRFFWLVYLCATSLIVGGILIPSLYVPIRILSLFLPRFRFLSDKVLLRGVHFLMRIQIWMRLEIDLKTLENLLKVKKGCLLVSNHRSHLDTFLLLSRVSGVRLLAKSSLFYTPFVGIMMWMSGQIPVRRKNLKSFWKAMERISLNLRAGETVHVFPEMTRCSEGEMRVKPFSSAPFLRSIQENVQVVPLVFINTDRAWPSKKLGIRSGLTLQLFSLPILDPKNFINSEDFAKTTHDLIQSAFEKRVNAKI